MAIAAAFDHAVLVDDATTATALTYAEADGSVQIEQHSVSQRVRQGDETWAAVDEHLVQQDDGSWSPAVTPHPVTFSGGDTGDTGGTAEPATLATVTTSSGAQVTVGTAGLTIGAPTIAGDTARYPDVLPGVDLVLSATPDGMSQVLQINTAAAAQNPALTALTFAVDGAVLAASGGQTATATASDGSAVVTPTPTWWDASDGGSAAGPGGPGVPIPLTDTIADNNLTIDAAAPSSQPGVTYPLFVDPDFTNAQDGRTFTDNAYANVAYWNGAGASDAYQHVGYINAANSDDGRAHVTRSYWNIPLPQELAGAHVSDSTFRVQNVYSQSCTASPTTLFWTPAVNPGTTWNNQPTAYSALDTQTYAHGRSNCGPGGVDYTARAAVTQQIANHADHVTLMLGGTENNVTSWKKFNPDVLLTTTIALPPSAPSIIDNSCHRSPGLLTGDVLRAGESRQSANGQFTLIMQADGNLVEYKAGVGAVWSTGTASAGPNGVATLQGDGNFVVYRGSGGAVWSSNTYGVHGYGPTSNEYLVVQDDGNLVLYTNDGGSAWSSGTASMANTATWICYGNGDPAHPGQQQITVNAGNLNPSNQYYEMFESKDGASRASTSTAGTQTGSGVPYTWSAPIAEEGVYQFYARACVTARDSVAVCSGFSQLLNAVYDHTPPSAPTWTAGTVNGTAAGTTKNSATGTVGKTVVDVHVTAPPASDAVAGFEYTVQAATTNAESFVVNAAPLCGTVYAGFTTTCDAGFADAPYLHITPTDEHNQLAMVAFDLAGNVSTASTFDFYSKPDPDVQTYGHIWNTDSGPAGCTGSITDTVPGGPAATLSGGACRATSTDIAHPYAVLAPGTAGARAATSAGVIDTTKAFTVGAWLRTTKPLAGTNTGMTALSQQGAHESAFDLQDSNGFWGLCMPTSDAAQWSGRCVTTATADANAAAFTPGTWTFVVGEWDPINQQLRTMYLVGNGGASGNWHSISYSPNTPSSGPVWIGSGTSGGTEQPFNGSISDAFIAPGLASSSQIANYFSAGGNPSAGSAAVGGNH